jgi:hypothetical protein
MERKFAILAIGLIAASAAAQPASAQPAGSLSGTWDMYWQTKSGPKKSGHIVLRQNGSDLRAELHGKGKIDARGTVNGDSFVLRGTRMLIGYRIEGRRQGDRLQGSLKVMSVDKAFTAARRR